MKPARVRYRLRQFCRSVFVISKREELDPVQAILNPAQWELFIQLQPAEQKHAIDLYHRLVETGETQPDLLLAALLHDVGKLHYPLSPLERALAVIVQAISPGLALKWGRIATNEWEKIPAWRRAFVVAAQHAEWGADMARQAGASRLTEQLIRLHHQSNGPSENVVESNLQRTLWMLDNES